MTSDEIVMASAEVLGMERLKALCLRARQQEDWWLAYCSFCAWGLRMFLTGGFSEMVSQVAAATASLHLSSHH
jgi:hypothetical protein